MAIANIVVNDGKSTPVAHTFVPIQDGADARYVNDAGAQTLAGQETLGLKISRSANGTQAHTVRITLWDPTEVVNADTTVSVDHGSSADLRFNFAPNSTEAERKDVVMLAVNAAIAKISDITKLLPQL
jgi:hypothetical protein